MTEPIVVPEGVRLQALYPMRELEPPIGGERVRGDGWTIMFLPAPIAHPVTPEPQVAERLDAALAEVRAAAGERREPTVVWLLAPDCAALAEPLAERGLVNEDTPGFEAVANAMVLLAPPSGSGGEDVVVKEVETLEEWTAGQHALAVSFGMPPEAADDLDRRAAERYRDYLTPGDSRRTFVALLGGKIVGCATAALGPAGVNLFSAGVLPEARGLGVYRALTLARWELAVERGTPALTIQAGRMSMPIAERLGFTKIGEIQIFVDALE